MQRRVTSHTYEHIRQPTRGRVGGHDGGQSGQGLTTKDIMNGIQTIAAKLESMCFGYERMKALFGERQNINPSHVAQIGTISQRLDHNEDDDANNPDTDLYWNLNNREDPGINDDDGVSTGHELHTEVVDSENHSMLTATAIKTQTTPATNKRQLPQTFPLEEKRPRKDFAAAYLEGQTKLLELEERKFEHLKAEH
ncbi:hypothetical protein AC1031_017180 [Aphanomyces cochlioides]|nr:hypothetical protein AC1031_017180 [Aphanomyces cochlioides]